MTEWRREKACHSVFEFDTVGTVVGLVLYSGTEFPESALNFSSRFPQELFNQQLLRHRLSPVKRSTQL